MVGAQHFPVVGGQHHQGVLLQTVFFQIIVNSSELLVNPMDRGKILPGLGL